MRIVLFTGKGGVGKTSIAAATALVAAKQGYKTLVISTDPAHSLGDSLDVELSGEPKKIIKNLYAEEINVQNKIEENWNTAKVYLATLFSSQNIDEIIAEELSILPGMDELFSLIEINKYYKEKEFDFLVIDCAPTGATLRLLSLPDIASWYMQKIFPIERKLAKIVRPIAKAIIKVPLANDEVYETFQNVYEKAALVKEILSDNKTTSVRIVVNPEKMVIKESQRAYTYLSLFGFSVDCVIVNRVLPDEISDPFFNKWKKTQLGYLNLINEAFAPLPILKAPLFDKEIVGIKSLEELATQIYSPDLDSTKVFYKEKLFSIKKEGKIYNLFIKLPFAKKEEMELSQHGDELIIKVKDVKRIISLPDTLVNLNIKEAEFKENELVVKFE